jgi:hypothetical protein
MGRCKRNHRPKWVEASANRRGMTEAEKHSREEGVHSEWVSAFPIGAGIPRADFGRGKL